MSLTCCFQKLDIDFSNRLVVLLSFLPDRNMEELNKFFSLFFFLVFFVISMGVVHFSDHENQRNRIERQQLPGQSPGQIGVCPSLIPSSSPYIEFPIPQQCMGGVPTGTRCHVGCMSGFELVGACSRVCFEGVWTGAESACIDRRIQCPRLGVAQLQAADHEKEYEYEATILPRPPRQQLSGMHDFPFL